MGLKSRAKLELKTKPQPGGASAFLSAVPDERRRAESQVVSS